MIFNLLNINRQTEVIFIILIAILVLSFDKSELTSDLEELWKFDFGEGIKKNNIDIYIKYILTAVVLVRTTSSRIYLGLYVILLWPTILEKKAYIIVPWLIMSFIRSILINLIAFSIGAYICLVQKGCHLICLEFCIAQIIEHGPSIYAHYSMYKFYQILSLNEKKKNNSNMTMSNDENTLNKYFHYMQVNDNERVDDDRNVITESTITNLINHLEIIRPMLVTSRSLDSLLHLQSSKILDMDNTKFESIPDHVKKILELKEVDISRAKSEKSSRILPKFSSGMVLVKQATREMRKKINLEPIEVELNCVSLNDSTNSDSIANKLQEITQDEMNPMDMKKTQENDIGCQVSTMSRNFMNNQQV